MNKLISKSQENKSIPVANSFVPPTAERPATFQLKDNRVGSILKKEQSEALSNRQAPVENADVVQRVIAMRASYYGRKTDGNILNIQAAVGNTIRLGVRANIQADLVNLRTSIASRLNEQRAHHPGTAAYNQHQVRIVEERALRDRLNAVIRRMDRAAALAAAAAAPAVAAPAPAAVIAAPAPAAVAVAVPAAVVHPVPAG